MNISAETVSDQVLKLSSDIHLGALPLNPYQGLCSGFPLLDF